MKRRSADDHGETAAPLPTVIDRLSGIVLFVTAALVVVAEWGGGQAFFLGGAIGAVAFLSLVATRVGWSRRAFIAIAVALFIVALATRADWTAMTEGALKSTAFVAAFYIAMAWLRNAAGTSPTVESCGRFLADQPPGRRYLALTAGGHLFGVVLNYGAITLLGSLAESGARREPDHQVRTIRTRRMLLAVQRGFVSTLCWSPLSFSLAISTSVVPGAAWTGAVGFCLVSAVILVGLGWTLDALFKPKLSGPPPQRTRPAGSWAELKPLLGLLALLMATVGGLQWATGVRAVAVVMVVAPILSLAWIALQGRGEAGGAARHMARRAVAYVRADLADYRSDLVLLMMAAFIGTIGAGLLAPMVSRGGLDFTAVPAWAVLIGLVWLVPIAGQLGMNPILSVSLAAPLLPRADALGVTPDAVVVALTAGWALTGASSPFTATTLFVGALGRVSARKVGLRWNGAFTLIGAGLLSVWVAIVVGL